jgi:hypothetical protein
MADLPAGLTPQDIDAFQRELARCWIVAGLLIGLPLERLDELSLRAEATGPKVYPDIWRKNAEKIMQDREMVVALVRAQRHLLTTSPSLQELGSIEGQAESYRPRLEAAFRDVFRRREVALVSPLAILSAFVRYIARLAPELAKQKGA